MTISNTFNVKIVGASYLSQVAAAMPAGTWSGTLAIPGFDVQTTRFISQEQYDNQATWGTINVGAELDYVTHGNRVKDWNWMSKALYDPVTKRVLIIYSPHIETGHPWATLMLVYDETTNSIVAYQDPLNDRTVGHGFDNNGIWVAGRRLFKQVYYGIGATSRFTTGGIGEIDLDQITLTRSSAEWGAALVRMIPDPPTSSQLTAGGLDFFPELGAQGSLMWFGGRSMYRWDYATETWSLINGNLIPTTPGDDYTIHCVGHYNPLGQYFIAGGGSYDGANKFSRSLWKLDSSGVLTQVDDAPFVLSVNNSTNSHHTIFVPHPSKATDIVIRHDMEIWELDTTKTAGTQWTQLTTLAQWPADWPLSTTNCGFACTLAHLNCIMVFRYGDAGTASARLYKLP